MRGNNSNFKIVVCWPSKVQTSKLEYSTWRFSLRNKIISPKNCRVLPKKIKIGKNPLLYGQGWVPLLDNSLCEFTDTLSTWCIGHSPP